MSLIIILIGITVLFFLLLALKNIFKMKKVCVICLSIALTWIFLLALFWSGKFHDKTIMALLIGQTIVGVYYILERKVNRPLLIFRLPFLLTAIFIAYSILEIFIFNALIFIFVLWILFFIVYLFKNNEFANKLIECCKKW